MTYAAKDFDVALQISNNVHKHLWKSSRNHNLEAFISKHRLKFDKMLFAFNDSGKSFFDLGKAKSCLDSFSWGFFGINYFQSSCMKDLVSHTKLF